MSKSNPWSFYHLFFVIRFVYIKVYSYYNIVFSSKSKRKTALRQFFILQGTISQYKFNF